MRRQRAVSRVEERVETEVQPGVIAEVGTTGRSRREQAPGRRRHLRAGWTSPAGAIRQRLAVFYVAAFDLGGEVAGELEAGVGAGQRPADDRRSVHGDAANSNVFRGGRALPRGKIGGLRARDADDTRADPSNRLFMSVIFDLQ